MDESICKIIPGTDDQYIIYRSGHVKSLRTGRYLVGDHNNCGYARVMLSVGTRQFHKFRHRLVAEAFIPNPDNLRVIDHIDGNKDNNDASNLRWVNDTETVRAAMRTKLRRGYSPIEVTYQDGSTAFFETKKQLADALGITATAVGIWVNRPPSGGPCTGYLKRGIKSIRKVCQFF